MALPVKQGLSAPYVTTIPEKWDKQWFRGFITNFLSNADLRNVKGNGISVTGNVSGNTTTATVSLDTIVVGADTILGNPTGFVGPAQDMSPFTTMSLLRGVTPIVWTGNHTFAPSSGVPVTVTAPAGSHAANLSGASGQVSLLLTSANTPTQAVVDLLISRPGSTANTQFEGPSIELFDSTNTHAATLQSSGGQVELWQTISGVSRQVEFWDTSGVCTLKSSANHATLILSSLNSGTFSGTDFDILRAGSTANAFLEGPSIQLTDSTAAKFSSIQHSGGQTEIWQGPGASPAQVAFWDTNKAFNAQFSAIINAASGTRALTLNGTSGQVNLSIVSGNTSIQAVVDILVSRANSTANTQFEGPSIELFDSTNTNATVIQNSGGQTEIWQTNSGTSRQVALWNSSRNLTLNAPAASTVTLTVTGQASVHNIVMASGAGILQQNTVVPGFVMSSGGTNWSQIQNDAANTWSIASGTTSTSRGTPVIQWTPSAVSILGSTSAVQENITPDHGSFTATATGITGSPTSTVTWRRIGNIVELHIVSVSGTSSANTFTLTGLPANIQPATTTFQQFIVGATDNGVFVIAECQIINASGTINMLLNGNASGWTASGTKAFGSCTLYYTLD